MVFTTPDQNTKYRHSLPLDLSQVKPHNRIRRVKGIDGSNDKRVQTEIHGINALGTWLPGVLVTVHHARYPQHKSTQKT